MTRLKSDLTTSTAIRRYLELFDDVPSVEQIQRAIPGVHPQVIVDLLESWSDKVLREMPPPPTVPLSTLKEIYILLKDHPTNVNKLYSGQDGYDHRARYAYLVAKDALIEMGEV